ncbi:mRNA stability protein [Ceratobasidium theobromae]|uniref:mRNA stability protein n=1 Tax=Ceratobasidium theobromae TaxID=1582974 RepID=A0A5N5QVU6_9AGAM|nr:mRNA stability protein [Ceratobasidium theobromae]
MLPAQRKKVDMSTMTEEEKKLFRLYGKLPTHKNVLTKVQKDRKYFDSGDYALSKAGVTPQAAVGTAIPHPENIPHVTPAPHPNIHAPLSTSPTGQGGSPIKELVSGSDTSPPPPVRVPIIAQPIPASETTESAPDPAPGSPLAAGQ